MNRNFEMSPYCILCRDDQRGKQLSSAENPFFKNFDRRLMLDLTAEKQKKRGSLVVELSISLPGHI